MSAETEQTSQRRNLTQSRHRLRNLYNTEKGPDRLNYRGHTLVAENPDHPTNDAYELRQDGRVLGTVERSDFSNPEQWVRFIDHAIQDSYTSALENLWSSDFNWGEGDQR